MIADNFELEQPPEDEEVVDDIHERLLLTDMNSADTNTFTTARGTDDSEDIISSNVSSSSSSSEYVEYHDILKQLRHDSEGTAETEQSFDSAASNIRPRQYNDTTNHSVVSQQRRRSQEMKLVLTFLLMVVVGTGMKIFQKLQAIPYVHSSLQYSEIYVTLLILLTLLSNLHTYQSFDLYLCLSFLPIQPECTTIQAHSISSKISYTSPYASCTSSPLVDWDYSTIASQMKLP